LDRRDFQELSRVRAREAKALLNLGLCDGAYYLAGYAVECALKACIAKGTRRYEFPDKKRVDSSYSHSLRDLVRVAGLEGARAEYARQSVEFQDHWEAVQSWSEQSRYDRHSKEKATELVIAVGDRRYGVIAWIKRYW
jgi:HEPN domain-containing protein